MSTSFSDWSKDRLAGMGVRMPKADWHKHEQWTCELGEVVLHANSWLAKVNIGCRLVPVKGEFDSAAVAMGVVERVWKREEEKRNGNLTII